MDRYVNNVMQPDTNYDTTDPFLNSDIQILIKLIHTMKKKHEAKAAYPKLQPQSLKRVTLEI
jgi:hypothetical protein